MTAEQFIVDLNQYQSDIEKVKIQRYFKITNGSLFMGIKMGQLFKVAQDYMDMPLQEVALLLENPIHEIRAGALSIMDKKGRNKKTSDAERKAMFELYMSRLDQINNWDLVDISCQFVVGRYLWDKPRAILYQLAQSDNIWARRTAIVSTGYFLRNKQADDTFAIAAILVNDSEDLIRKAVGGWIRQAGKTDKIRLIRFLDVHAATMPRVMLRYALEHFEPEEKAYYMSLKK
ncbi:DNA alkylation repair protein [Flavobacterium cerinum]|uniref:DNA alkylation repair protein n=1 Tax=Flavobacterium cerinum TaxID=2502784 RepID=A0ABY5IWI2_9FLAO|nr:DNA alkylation repair protein [Flavobacterium cerinum]UUC45709.1 DNA alkylation repair protein [Flavobacterium cerinum]